MYIDLKTSQNVNYDVFMIVAVNCLLKGENLSPVIIHVVKMHHLAIHQVYLDRSYVVV